MRRKFDEQLVLLNNSLIEMGSMVEKAITDATHALVNQDVVLAQKIIDSDDQIDNKEKEIEGLCLKLLMQQHPVAQDLRFVSSALKMLTDLERVGDHASDISEIILMLADKKYVGNLEHIPHMAKETMKMLSESIDAYVKRDLDLAKKVIDYDDVVDNIFVKVKKDMINLIHDNPANGDEAIDLVMIAKYFERIGDHATNIAEWVIFSLTGTYKESKIMGY
ncbi:MAG: phosphate signaling complex protein PhoU [Clostridiales bacterium]|nr:phosphate signaling complex protein PhoU [Clostridiales bacterium]